MTDFGLRDGYVGVMKGVILGIDPRRRTWCVACPGMTWTRVWMIRAMKSRCYLKLTEVLH